MAIDEKQIRSFFRIEGEEIEKLATSIEVEPDVSTGA